MDQDVQLYHLCNASFSTIQKEKAELLLSYIYYGSTMFEPVKDNHIISAVKRSKKIQTDVFHPLASKTRPYTT